MDRDTFTTHFRTAARGAWSLARSMVLEDLPERLVFRVHLNQSYDGNPALPGEVRFPEDSTRERAAALRRCDESAAVAALWRDEIRRDEIGRDGLVPQWVNLTAVDEDGTSTVVEVVCCGRFTRDDARLYHVDEGYPPFHVLSPALPPGHDGSPFSLHLRKEYWDQVDTAHPRTVAERVRMLTVATDLAAVPDLPHVEVIEHRGSSVADLSGFARFPALRHLRLYLASPTEFHVTDAGHRLAALETLMIANLPDRPWGQAALADVAPSASSLSLSATGTLWLDGRWSPALRRLTVRAAALAGPDGQPAELPADLDSLDVKLTGG